jgi:serine phosphatase RsbU (regulator of sigma subunit)
MSTEMDVDLPSLSEAKLRSERIRILCMMGLFAAFVLLGLFRIVVPWNDKPSIGWLVFGMSILYLASEAAMFRAVTGSLGQGRTLDRRLGIVLGVFECLYPILVGFALIVLSPDERFTLLVSPAYAFLLILIAISVLRVDWWATAFTGLFAALGYGGLVVWALASGESGRPNPHPPAMYANLVVMIGLATVAAVFVARQVEGYVESAVREMETRRQRDQLKRDLEIASEIQQRLLPRAMPNLAGYDFAAVSRPADETGGDYYDWQEVSRERVVLSLADVTGHGVGPALVTAACRAYVRVILGNDTTTAAVLARVNSLLQADLPESRFVTLALLDVDAAAHDVHLLSAGHGPTLHVRGTDGETRQIDAQGLPLGLSDDPLLDDPVKFHLDTGDLVVLCSDGFFEPANPSGEAYGMERLIQVLQTHRHESASAIVAAMEQEVRQFIDTAPQPDDMTAVVIKRALKSDD